ncbi:MBL fold metallo-hydrolase [Paenibacillus sp. UNC499MF]|uniref:MBL fold metallo-hydrolase n=1 Tax=Paenibacillus sp. UNC499MF TaxID=1502751 RepID=UPI0008A0929E|nr:MBL fold metallo-hydrolase [Paenibacillus sp. UNC499MF]SEG43756.1 phosphoribosyl 1,2-cyclic phosphate phosphodiesterase [Paenibacillus sp. UNC499MF]
MKVHFLGSAASEGIPNPFCKCEVCEKTRSEKGKNIRTRSAAIVDDTMQIDFPPEYSCQVMRDDVDVTRISELLFTHTHPDHFNAGDLFSRMEGYGHHVTHPLHIFGNDRAVNGCLDVLSGYSPQRFQFTRLIPFVTVESGGARITPLLANHAKWETCLIYFIEKEGKTLLYGHDSGWFPELTWSWLADKHIDLTVLECTHGYNQNPHSDGHMSIETVLETQKRLLDSGIHSASSRIIVSHLSHNSGFMHDELVDIFKPYGIEVAYDGLIKFI